MSTKPKTDCEKRERIAAAAAVRGTHQTFTVPAGDRLIPGRRVCELRGLTSRMTLWRHVKRGTIPQPDATIHGRHYWLESRFVKRAGIPNVA